MKFADELIPGHPYICVDEGTIPRFYTRREDGTVRLGSGERTSSGGFAWFAPGTPLVYVGTKEMNPGGPYRTYTVIMLCNDGQEVLLTSANPHRELPIISVEEWIYRVGALGENIDTALKALKQDR